MKHQFKALLLALLCWSQATYAATPIIWGGSGARNLQNSSNVGTGTGAKNYAEPSMNSAAGWTASGAGVTVVTESTAANYPRATTGSGIRITGVSGSTAYAYFRFTLDQVDYTKKLLVQFDQAPISGYAASDFKVDVYSNTTSVYGGTSTRLALSTDSSAISALPLLTGTYRAAFDAPGSTAPYIEVRVGLNGTNTHALTLSDFYVGPGTVQQGAAVSEWAAYTPTIAGVTTSVSAGKWRRVGDSMEVEGYFTASGTSTTVVSFALPANTIDTTKIPSAGSIHDIFGSGHVNAATLLAMTVVYNGSNTVKFVRAGDSNQIDGTRTIVSGNALDFRFTVPIAEWSGSGTVNVVSNDIETVSNSNVTAATTTDTASYVTGPSGSLLLTGTPAGDSVTRQVQWATPIQAGDSILLQVSSNGSTWGVGAANVLTGGYVEGLRFDGTNYIGIGLDAPGAAGATTSTVRIGKYRAGTSSTWDGTGRWRVIRYRGGQAIGFGDATTASSGLVNTGPQSFGGSKTFVAPASSAMSLTLDSTASTNQNAQTIYKGNYTGPTAQQWNLGLNIGKTDGSFEVYNSTGASSMFSVSPLGNVLIKNTTSAGSLSTASKTASASGTADCDTNISGSDALVVISASKNGANSVYLGSKTNTTIASLAGSLPASVTVSVVAGTASNSAVRVTNADASFAVGFTCMFIGAW